jgi:hypothetical protein
LLKFIRINMVITGRRRSPNAALPFGNLNAEYCNTEYCNIFRCSTSALADAIFRRKIAYLPREQFQFYNPFVSPLSRVPNAPQTPNRVTPLRRIVVLDVWSPQLIVCEMNRTEASVKAPLTPPEW